MTDHYHNAYGLGFRSEMALPELLPGVPDAGADVHIRRAAVPQGLEKGTQLGPYLWATPREFFLEVPEVGRFLIREGREIVVDPAEGADEDSVRVFLLGSAFGALLFQRGHLVLHGNAIRIGDQCMVCVGHSGAGKSTLAAGFLRRGYPVLADDVVPVDDQCRAIPGFPRIKLWQDAAEKLGVETEGLRRITPGLEKFNLPVVESHCAERLPIRWVYILNTHNEDQTLFEPVGGMQRFMPLRQNTYRVRFLDGMALKAEHLGLCGRLASTIRLVRITRPERGFGLDALIDDILADMARNP